jgi:hypothetical protein
VNNDRLLAACGVAGFIVILAFVIAAANDFQTSVWAQAMPTPEPTAEPLTCKFVRVPGRPVGADLCTMPGGGTCLFDRGSEPTICYPGQERHDEN